MCIFVVEKSCVCAEILIGGRELAVNVFFGSSGFVIWKL
jgi:hypothetical protein